MIGNAQPDGVAAAGHLGAITRSGLRRTTIVSGPGQNASASTRAASGTSRARSSSCVGARDVHDHGMIGGPALHREQPAHRVDVRGVGAEPVHRLGRKRDELAGAQRVDRARDRQPARSSVYQ